VNTRTELDKARALLENVGDALAINDRDQRAAYACQYVDVAILNVDKALKQLDYQRRQV